MEINWQELYENEKKKNEFLGQQLRNVLLVLSQLKELETTHMGRMSEVLGKSKAFQEQEES